MTARLALGTLAAVGAATYWTTMSSQSQLLGNFPIGDPRGGRAGQRTLALTFDDGPNEPFTTRLADLLEQRGARGTFFQVGRAVAREPDTSRALLAAGHVIGNHSYSHALQRCFTARQVDDEIRRSQDVFGDVLQLRPRLYRPPWLARTAGTFSVLRRHDLHAVSGTFCHPLEVARLPPERIATRAVARSRPGRMIIFHDGYNGRGADRTRTLDAVERTVDTLATQGWSFVTVDELLRVAPYGTSE